MPGVGELGHLTDAQYADLVERVDRFHEAWIPDEPANPASFLPSRTAPHRQAVLIEILKTDLELRAKSQLPVRIEPYLAAFPDEIPPNNVPVTLLLEEYLVRHRLADRPAIEEYKNRFPALYDQFAAGLAQLAGKSAGAKAGLGRSRGAGAAEPPKLGESSVAFNSTSELILSNTQIRDVQPNAAAPPGTLVEKIEPVLSEEDEETRKKKKKLGKSKRTKSRSKIDLNEVPPDTVPAELEYKLLRKLGQGTFGEVYEALAPGGFRVAVKKILRSMDHPASVGELESLEAIKTMTHPYLLQTQAYWVFRDRLIIVMELADGSLTDMIKDAVSRGLPGVPVDDLVTYFEQVAEAVDYLHSQNVSHRDIKPANLLHLKGYAKLADFGLARMHEHTQTTVGQEMGTPLFMAPEAWNKKISLHSDQYSLAATYVSARLNRNLYKVAAMHELAIQHMTGTPDLDPLEPAEQAVLMRALAKNPDDRYPNCKAFVKALRQATTPVPIKTAVDIDLDGPRSRLGPLTVALALVLLVSVAGLIYVAVFSQGTPVVAPTEPKVEKILSLAGWTPNETAGTLTLPDGRKIHKEVSREVGGTTLVAVAVPPARNTDPPPYYMLRDKVSNRVFKAVWEAADKNDRSAVAEFRKRFGKDAKPLLPGMWRQGALPQIGEPLGIEGAQADVPVLNLTMPEASLVATELGGSLPTYLQWQHAVEGPGGTLPDLLAKWKPKPGQTEPTEEDLEQLGVALGLKFGPWPVTRVTPDVSVHGVRELISNGYEWTNGTADGPLDLRSNPAVTPKVIVVGQGWDIPEVLTPSKIAGLKSQYPWDSDKTGIGFRVVFEPQ